MKLAFIMCFPGSSFCDQPQNGMLSGRWSKLSALSVVFSLWLAITHVQAQDMTVASGELHKIELAVERLEEDYFAYRMRQHIVSDMDGANERDITSQYPDFATIPGPTFIISEGDKVHLTLIHQFDPLSPGENQVSVHVHGVHYDVLSDGTLKYINLIKDQSAVPAMAYTYQWYAAPGTAGTWAYHDQSMFSHHGAGDKGLFGALIVNKKSGGVEINLAGKKQSIPLSNIRKEYVLYVLDDAFTGTEIDNQTGQQSYLGENPTFSAQQGTDVRFHIIALGTVIHNFRLNGYGWLDPGTNNIIEEKAIAPLERHVFAIRANASGVYQDAVLSSRLLGMKGDFNVVR